MKFTVPNWILSSLSVPVLVAMGALAAIGARAADLRGDLAYALGDYATARQEWQREAASGDASAMAAIGMLYDTGHGVAQDFGQALDWYRRAADAGNLPAMFNVATMLENGRGTQANPREAARWYGRAAAQGDGRAAYDLATLYRDGIGVRRDPQAAIRYFRMAASAGIVAARSNLVALGAAPPAIAPSANVPPGNAPPPAPAPAAPQAPPPDMPAIIAQAQNAALDRTPLSPEAQQSFAAIVLSLADQAAQGDGLAQYDVGFAYEHGYGEAVDRVRAYVWYLRATAASNEAVRAAALKGASELGRVLTEPEHEAARNMLVGGGP